MIVEQYVHTLIPQDAQFCPKPEQVILFFDDLSKMGAAPLGAKFKIVKPCGRLRSGTEPATGETIMIHRKEIIAVDRPANISPILSQLNQYEVAMEGQGPPPLPPFPLYDVNEAPFAGTYGFTVRCCIEAQPAPMSDLGVPFFGDPCRKQSGTALFRHPLTSVLMEVPHASCARFWVEFEFGRWLVPKIYDTIEILNPAITDRANRCFGLEFAQGFHSL